MGPCAYCLRVWCGAKVNGLNVRMVCLQQSSEPPPPSPPIRLTFNNDAVNAQGRVGAHHPSPRPSSNSFNKSLPSSLKAVMAVGAWCSVVRTWSEAASQSKQLHHQSSTVPSSRQTGTCPRFYYNCASISQGKKWHHHHGAFYLLILTQQLSPSSAHRQSRPPPSSASPLPYSLAGPHIKPSMYPQLSPHAQAIYKKLTAFVEEECLPAEEVFEEQHAALSSRWMVPAVVETLKAKAKSLGLWNLFMMEEHVYHSGLNMIEYAVMSEVMGRSFLAPEACNCNAPDTGNMEVLAKYGNAAQRARWLTPLMAGTIRSTFLMTEPAVASSDATNICMKFRREGDEYVVNGRKWWSSGAMDPRCHVALVMGKVDGAATNAARRHQQHSILIVPMDAPGLKVLRPLTVFGFDDAPHGHAEVELVNVRVPVSNLVLGEGDGFKIAQGRLGPGRIHHCMRAIGLSERVLALAIKRAMTRKAFGQELARQGTVQRDLAQCRMELDQARLLVLHAAWRMDTNGGAKGAQQEIAMIKVVAPNMGQRVVDIAIQIHGGMGVCQDTILARAFAYMRSLRIADGPDEVHTRTVARYELKRMMDGKTQPSADAWYRSTQGVTSGKSRL